MKVLILENNLMWSSRLRQSLAALGHLSVVAEKLPEQIEPFDLAIVNLGSATIEAEILALKAAHIPLIAHAGHKEKELHALGAQLGCDRLVTNSELTWKLENLLTKFSEQSQGRHV